MNALFAIVALVAAAAATNKSPECPSSVPPGTWPDGKKAAFYLSFDDGCPTQTKNVFPLLEKYRIPGTFYVCPEWDLFKKYEAAWSNANEYVFLGNHTMTHGKIPDKAALDSAERQGVDMRMYRVIYQCIEEIEAAMKGMLAPKFRENLLGHAEVRQTIHVPGVGTIAGSYILDGKIARHAQIRVVRDGIVIFEDKISSLKRFKDDAKEVAQGYECGVGLEKFNDIKEGDILEAFVMEEIER
jgi:hypothetical protein